MAADSPGELLMSYEITSGRSARPLLASAPAIIMQVRKLR